MRRRLVLGVVLFASALPCRMRASDVIQVDVRAVLNGRSVTTLTDGSLVTWTRGIDGAGLADGYLTRAAAAWVGDAGLKALPGDGFFPADARHPDVRLTFTDGDGTGAQTRGLSGAGQFSIEVPPHKYARMQLFMTSAEGASQLVITLRYADGGAVVREKRQPDYYNAPPADDPDYFALATDLAKWNPSNHRSETGHHYIHGVDLRPDAARTLTGISVAKAGTGYLVFWGATGVTR